MAIAGTTASALLFSFSAVLLLFLQAPAPAPGLADLLASALDRFLDGRGLLELATRRNMILLCHAILLLILRDAGVLGTPASRRSRSSPQGEATDVVTQTAAPARPHATTRGVVVWRRRPRNRAVAAMHQHDAAAAAAAARCLVEYQPAATWAAPVLTTGPPAAQAEEAAAVATKQTIVLVESPRNDDDGGLLELEHHDHGPDAVVDPHPLEHPTATERDCDDRRIISVADDVERMDDDTARTAGMELEMEMEMELADDRTFEEFIKSQRRKMRQESMQLVRSGYQYQAMATCH